MGRCKRVGRAGRTMVLSETRLEAGLVLVPVLREGLGFGEGLGLTEGRATGHRETSSRTGVPDPGAGRGQRLEPAPGGVRALRLRLQGQLGWIEGFSCLPDVKGEGGELAGEGDAGEFLAHAALEEVEIEIAEGTGPAGGGRGGTLEDILDDAVVMAIETAGHGTATAADGAAVHDGVVRAGAGDDGKA